MLEQDRNLRIQDLPGSTEISPFRVGILPVPGFALLSYACTVEPLRAANLLSDSKLYEIVHFSADGRVPSSGAASIEKTRRPGGAEDLDLLLVVAGGDPFAFDDVAILEWLRRLDSRGVRIGGVSGGSVILAMAGLMEGRRMTVHWEHAAALSEIHPDCLIERRLYVMDRDRVTCGGGTAPLDLMHALISSQWGAGFARLVSDWFLHTDVRAAADPQRGTLAERLGSNSPHLVEAVSAMEDHIADPLSLSQLAMVAGVTPRHLNRLFAERLGRSTMAYYREMRLDVAQRLIKNTPMSIAEVSEATGFATSSHFSGAYRRNFGASPRGVRRADVQAD
ncbi:MAG: GlxA family transcriptional regulator [Boseongicola sp. SB0677_bin_26]|nr:GlxA family transcriptional regulator [Boseongicola sp. SB0665_bin_10]MYG28641.1 GlxA family transcriptional regulator [Boseongicola sp. SB0677_bin_26]